VLVDRVIRLMLAGTEPSRIMCLTFTKAAAAEMANRLFERLSNGSRCPMRHWRSFCRTRLAAPGKALLERARQLFTRALETPGGLKIQTIHAFCERVLQLFPVEAGVVPHFTMLDDREALGLLQSARNAVLQSAKSDAGSVIGAALLDVANRVNPDQFDDLLTQLLAQRSTLRHIFDEEAGLARAESLLRQHLSLEQGLTREALLQGLSCEAERYLQLADLLDAGSKTEKETALRIRQVAPPAMSRFSTCAMSSSPTNARYANGWPTSLPMTGMAGSTNW
jgi:ATP-dependent helicase/nuclease subunit A